MINNKLKIIHPHNVGDGSITVGFGHYIQPSEWKDYNDKYNISKDKSDEELLEINMTVEDALQIFKNDITFHSSKVEEYLKDNNISVTQNEFDALVIYRYNKGNIGAVLDLLKSGNKDKETWYKVMVNADGASNFENSLTNRRKWQNSIYFDNYYDSEYFGFRKDIIIPEIKY